MTTLAQDSFTRANNASVWGTASDSNTWATAVANSVALSISSNEGVATEGSSFASMLLGSGTSGPTEGLVRLTADQSAAGPRPGIILRSSANGQTFYVCRVTSATLIAFARYDGVATGNGTFLQSATISFTNNTFYWLRFRVTGDSSTNPHLQARFWQDGTTEPGTWINDFTDASVSALKNAGQYGLYIGTVTGTAKFDTFSVNDTSTGPTIHTMTSEDDLVASDRFVATGLTLPVDALSVSESLLTVNQSLSIDSFVTSDSFLAVQNGLATDSLSASDSAIFTQVFAATEPLAVSDSFVATDIFTATDAFSVDDSFFGLGLAEWTENIPASDSFVSINLHQMSSADLLILTSSLQAIGLHLPIEAIAASSGLLVVSQAVWSELLAVSERALSINQSSFTDSLTASDNGGQLAQVFTTTDALSVTDSFLALGGAAWTNTLPLSASFVSIDLYQVSSTDQLALISSLLSIGIALPLEALSASSSVLTVHQALWGELLSVSESFTWSASLPALPTLPSLHPLGSSPAFYQGKTVIPTFPSGVYLVNGVALDSQPILCTAPNAASGLKFQAGSTFFLLFERPTILTQALLADGSVVPMTFATASGQMVTGQVQVASTLTITGRSSTFSVLCTLLSSAVALAL